MPTDPRRFANRVLEAFLMEGNRTEAQILRAGGPSTSTMTKLRKVAAGDATMSEPREPTWTKIEKAAGWAPGSARRVWDGGEPRESRADPDDNHLARLEAEVQRLADEIRRLRGGVDESTQTGA